MGKSSRPKPKHLAEKVKQIRLVLNLSQTEMLMRLGYPTDKKEFRSIISAYELGKREPTLIDLLNYAKSVSISVDKIIDDNIEVKSFLETN